MIRLSRSLVGEMEIDAVATVIRRGFLGMGAEAQCFEQELASFIGGGVSVACVNTGTSALHLALQAVGVGPGDEVLVPTLTYVATFQAVSACGAVPVACDVSENTGLLDLSDAEKRITPKTRAVIPVHYASFTGDLNAVYAFAGSHGLRVVEDAAHAFGCEFKGKRVGSFGDVVCFSFDGIKNITSGEGGAVVSADGQVIAKVQDARLLGVQKDTEKRFRGERSWDFDVTEQGWRFHMSDIMAAIGRVQLKRFERDLKPARVSLAGHYIRKLQGLSPIRFFGTDLSAVVPHIMPIQILGGKRDAVRAALLENDIEAGLHYKPNHLLSKFGHGAVRLPVAEKLYNEILSLPLHPGLTVPDVDRVTAVIERVLS